MVWVVPFFSFLLFTTNQTYQDIQETHLSVHSNVGGSDHCLTGSDRDGDNRESNSWLGSEPAQYFW